MKNSHGPGGKACTHCPKVYRQMNNFVVHFKKTHISKCMVKTCTSKNLCGKCLKPLNAAKIKWINSKIQMKLTPKQVFFLSYEIYEYILKICYGLFQSECEKKHLLGKNTVKEGSHLNDHVKKPQKPIQKRNKSDPPKQVSSRSFLSFFSYVCMYIYRNNLYSSYKYFTFLIIYQEGDTSFEFIDENLFYSEFPREDTIECVCKEICGNDCLNRRSFDECSIGSCKLGMLCDNNQIKRKKWASIEIFLTEKKRFRC